MFLQRTSKIS